MQGVIILALRFLVIPFTLMLMKVSSNIELRSVFFLGYSFRVKETSYHDPKAPKFLISKDVNESSMLNPRKENVDHNVNEQVELKCNIQEKSKMAFSFSPLRKRSKILMKMRMNKRNSNILLLVGDNRKRLDHLKGIIAMQRWLLMHSSW